MSKCSRCVERLILVIGRPSRGSPPCSKGERVYSSFISQVLVEIRFQSIFVASTTKFELWIVFKTQSYMQFHRKRASHPANIDHLKFLYVQIWIETTFKRKKNKVLLAHNRTAVNQMQQSLSSTFLELSNLASYQSSVDYSQNSSIRNIRYIQRAG